MHPGTHCKTHVEGMGKSARYSKSSRFRPRTKRKLKILKEKDDEDDQGKNKYVVYKDKCVICMVIAAFMVIMVIHAKHEAENSQSLPQLVGQMNHIVDALDAQAGTDLITKKQHRPAKKHYKKGSDAWQLWNDVQQWRKIIRPFIFNWLRAIKHFCARYEQILRWFRISSCSQFRIRYNAKCTHCSI